jgi:uncharacterized repeat protein (TIGR01451 family)
MKLVSGKTGLMIRLGVLVTAMLFGQQAMAVGTRANTLVENTASVDYDVATVPQTQLQSNTVQFVVDRRVDFTFAAQGAALVPVTPGGSDYFVDFLLTNTSNSVLDFNVTLTQMIGGLVRGQTDDADMALVDFAVSGDTVANGDPDPVRGVNIVFVDELEADAAIRIRVFGDAALTMADGEIAGVDMTLTGAEGGLGGTEGTTLVDGVANTDLGVENVFADGGNDNTEADQDGFIVESADLAVTKSYAVIAGDLGSGLPIPGATVEYSIAIVNSSLTTAADPVQIGDVLDTDVTFVLGGYLGATDFEITNGVVVTQCTAAVDGDDCEEVAGVITIGGAGTISLALNTTLTLTYQVLIPDPAVTP